MKRVERQDDPWSGHISLPGGHRDPGDGDLVETARREALEEIGLVVEGAPIVQLDDVHPMTPALPPVVVRPFVFVVEPFRRLILGNEATLEIRVDLTDLAAGRTHRTVVERDTILSVSGYDVGPHFVWGLTERVLTPFLRRLELL
jgi:8-oxo-dGTP pyrophosphatase MutT (NUDIX family)